MAAKRYRKFPIYNIITDLFARLSASISIFLFSAYFSKAVIGYYALSLAVLSVPMNFIGSAIGEVFYEKAASARNKGTLPTIVEKLFKLMTWVAMMPILLLAIIGDSLFSFAFGIKWTDAGVYAQILSFKMYISFVISPLSNLANILERQEAALILGVITTINSIVSILVGGYLNNIYITLIMLSTLDGLTFFIFGLVIFYILKISQKRIFFILLECFYICATLSIPLILAKLCFGSSLPIHIVISIIICFIYYSIFLKRDVQLRAIIIAILRKVSPIKINAA
jgi:O-antigen/teichoic acid export membrane protein